MRSWWSCSSSSWAGIITLVLDNPTSQIITGLGAAAAALGITWKGAGSVADKLLLAIGRPLWGAEIDASVSHASPIYPLNRSWSQSTPFYSARRNTSEPSQQPAKRMVPTQPQRKFSQRCAECLAPAEAARGTDYITARDHFWRKPSAQDLGYWLTWAARAGYLSNTGDTYRPTGEGARLAKLPARAQGAVRAALSAGRRSEDNA